MNEEYVIARLMEKCQISYAFAESIFIDLERRGLGEDLKFNIDNIEDYLDVYNRYYKDYLTNK